jgi:hypothetical protein
VFSGGEPSAQALGGPLRQFGAGDPAGVKAEFTGLGPQFG